MIIIDPLSVICQGVRIRYVEKNGKPVLEKRDSHIQEFCYSDDGKAMEWRVDSGDGFPPYLYISTYLPKKSYLIPQSWRPISTSRVWIYKYNKEIEKRVTRWDRRKLGKTSEKTREFSSTFILSVIRWWKTIDTEWNFPIEMIEEILSCFDIFLV